MRNISFLILLFLFSCSHFNGLRNPAGATLSLTKKRSLLWNSAYRMIMDEKPELQEKLKSFESDLKGFYKFIGKIERGEVSGVVSPLKKRGSDFSKMIINSNLSQVSYEAWKDMEDERLKAYFAGKYVFSYKESLYTLWGSELSRNNLSSYNLTVKNQMLPELSDEDYLLSFFNHDEFLETSNKRYFTLPRLLGVSDYQKTRFVEDFIFQTDLEGLDFDDLAKAHMEPFILDGYIEYFSAKNYLMNRGQVLDDSTNACETKAYVRSFSMRKIAKEFLATLVTHKKKLMKTLSMTNNEYNEMMGIAVGILGVESKMGTSLKYKFKEDLKIGKLNLGQTIIKTIKSMRGRSDVNSRGLTQIKNIGPLLENTDYSYLETADLDDPEHAAIATMFVLKEKFGYLMHFKKIHPHVDDFNWPDYIYYFYQGASREVTKGTGTPKKNLRIRKIMQLREMMMIFEKCD